MAATGTARPEPKYVPGRKSDVQDCQWLQKLRRLGFLRAAWRPDDGVCAVRAVVRQRELLLIEQVSWVQRVSKFDARIVGSAMPTSTSGWRRTKR